MIGDSLNEGRPPRYRLPSSMNDPGDLTLFALICRDFHESNPRGIVDADVDVFPTDAETAINHAGLAAGYPMPYGADPTELLDVGAWVFALIAPDRFSRLQSTQLAQATSTQDTAHSGWRDAHLYRDLLARPALSVQLLNLFHHSPGCRLSQPMWPR